MIFVQREGTVGTVRFTGDEARILDTDGNVVRDWTAGGVLADIPQGDGYVLEVRTGTTVTAEALAIGAVIFVMGQSNIQRWFDTPPGTVAMPGTYTMEWDGSIGSGVSGSAAQHFAEGYAAATGAPVLLVEGARGGTSLLPEADKGNGNWLSTEPGSLYANMLARLAQVGGSAEFVLWGQGETDASGGIDSATYAAALTTFMERVLADFAPERVLIQEIGPRGADEGDSKYDGVRAAQHQVAAAMAGVDIGALTLDSNTTSDGIHLTGASRVLAAERMLASAAAVLGIEMQTDDWTGSDDPASGDSRTGGSGRDVMQGLAGDDTLDGGEGSDVLLGGDGNDLLAGGGGKDIILGGNGDDTVAGGDGNDVIGASLGNDSVSGGAGDDEVWADWGDDTIEGGAGNDLIFGDTGTDTAVFSGLRAGYAISVSGSLVRVTDINPADGDDGADMLYGIEFLSFLDGVIDPRGSALPALFTETTDFVDFSLIVAGTYDPASLHAALGGNDEVYLPADAQAALLAGYDTSSAFDAGAGDDIVIGGSLAETIRGGDGSDILNGQGGADRMDGGAGDDLYFVDNSRDIVFERPDEGIDTVRSTVTLTLKSNVENLVLLGTGNIGGSGNADGNVIDGNAGSNKLSGREGDDTLRGGDGDDVLDGGAGADLLIGGNGKDRYVVDDIGDVIVELPGGGDDEVRAHISYTLADDLERLRLFGSDDISGTGNALDNRISGNVGSNTLDGGEGRDVLTGGDGGDLLFGGGGNDSLEGGLGADTMEGGAGRDRFIWRSLEEAQGGPGALETILDFERGDRLDLSRLDANAATGSNEAFLFLGTGAVTGAGQLRFEQDAAAGLTRVFGHVDADGTADFTIVLVGLLDLGKSDFSL